MLKYLVVSLAVLSCVTALECIQCTYDPASAPNLECIGDVNGTMEQENIEVRYKGESRSNILDYSTVFLSNSTHYHYYYYSKFSLNNK